ncbi:MAG: hypothetical protein U5K79_21205 [Cyclobacteriaceae bacterium]|nr:hypothetical protein [Cyclobacteriaceae bacterium]
MRAHDRRRRFSEDNSFNLLHARRTTVPDDERNGRWCYVADVIPDDVLNRIMNKALWFDPLVS